MTATATVPRELRVPVVGDAGFFARRADAERVATDFFAAVTACGAQALAGHDLVSQAAAVGVLADFARSQA